MADYKETEEGKTCQLRELFPVYFVSDLVQFGVYTLVMIVIIVKNVNQIDWVLKLKLVLFGFLMGIRPLLIWVMHMNKDIFVENNLAITFVWLVDSCLYGVFYYILF